MNPNDVEDSSNSGSVLGGLVDLARVAGGIYHDATGSKTLIAPPKTGAAPAQGLTMSGTIKPWMVGAALVVVAVLGFVAFRRKG